MRRIIKARELSDPPPLWQPDAPPKSGPAGLPVQIPRGAPVDARAVEQAARRKGLADGVRAAEESYRAKAARVESLAAALRQERAEFFDRIEPELVRLSVAIAEKVIGRELELRPETAVDIVRSAMKRLRDREALRVSVNPRDAEQVKAARDDLVSAVDGVRKFDVIEDRRVDPGGCVIESPNGTLDARISTQIQEIASALDAVTPDLDDDESPGPGPIPGSDQPD